MNNLKVISQAFEHNGLIPIDYTGYGDDFSPELILFDIDDAAQSIAIVMDDMNHPIPAYNHWLIWNIPVMSIIPSCIAHGAEVASLGGAKQGIGYGEHCYRGPKPPFQWSHQYWFHVYTLDSMLDIPSSSRKKDLMKAMKGKVLQHAILIGHYR